MRIVIAIFAVVALYPGRAQCGPPEPLEFNRLLAHWESYANPDYLKFVQDTKPEIVQFGFYGADFWSLADTPQGHTSPLHLPVRGAIPCRQWFVDRNRQLHELGVKIVGHMDVTTLLGDPGQVNARAASGFFQFYRDNWDETLLGSRPTATALELLQVDEHGQPRTRPSESPLGEHSYLGCLNNPAWRQVLKCWTKAAIEAGVDGLIATSLFRRDCVCPHCVAGFKSYLRERYTPEHLLRELEIGDLEQHQFREIVDWHEVDESTPLLREMLRYSQISTKRAFDEVFIEYGRSLKPDLIVAQWDHLADFRQINFDERCLLPSELWGRGEDYLWYSTAGKRSEGRSDAFVNEATLQARYVRGASGNKPYVIGKYERVHVRAAIAELAANGGAPMGFFTDFTDPISRPRLVQYYQFLARHQHLFHNNRPCGDVLLLYPRTRVHQGDIDAVSDFKQIGEQLLNDHILFDVMPDDLVTSEVKAAYGSVIDPVDEFQEKQSQAARHSRFRAPKSVRISITRPAETEGVTLHFVNYAHRPTDHLERPGPADDHPVPVKGVYADYLVPEGSQLKRVTVCTPEAPNPEQLEWSKDGEFVRFQVPEFLVYSVVQILTKPTEN